MDKMTADELLGFEIGSDKSKLKEHFDEYRELYAPDLLGAMNSGNERKIKNLMTAMMMVKNSKNICMTNDKEAISFLRFAELNDAYNILIKNPDYKEYSLDYDEMVMYDTKRQGKSIANFRRITAGITAFFSSGSYFDRHM